MPNRRKQLPENEIVRLYLTRDYTLAELRQRFGCSEAPIYRVLREAGVQLNGRSRPAGSRKPIDTSEIHRLYVTERLSEKLVAERLGVSRTIIRARLLEMGVEPRSYGGAQEIIWSHRTTAQRLAHLAKPHAAALGRTPTLEERLLTARTREKRVTHVSAKERELAAALRAHGLAPIHQKAIGPYNCDLAVGAVAVEVWGGNWHWYGHHRETCEERLRYILGAGWSVYVLPITKNDPLTDARVGDLVAYLEASSRNPPARREYRVVWSAGQWERIGYLDDDHFVIDPPFTGRQNPTTGRHERIAG